MNIYIVLLVYPPIISVHMVILCILFLLWEFFFIFKITALNRSLAWMSSERIHSAADSDTYTQSQTVGGAWGLIWKKRRKECGPWKGQKLPRKPNESTNLDPWGFQKLSHQPKSIPSLLAHMYQMYSLVFMWIMDNWSGGLSQKLFPVSRICSSNWAALPGLRGRSCA